MRETWCIVVMAGVLALGCDDGMPGGGAGGAGGAASGALKVAWVYVGPPGDLGWSYTHNQGRLEAESNLSNVVTTFRDNVAEADAERVMEELIAQGNRLIFTTSFGFGPATLAVAQRHPDVKFEHCSGNMRAANVSTYFGRMYQARYLTGMVAGRMTRTNKIGIPAAHPISEVYRHVNAMALGVRATNPAATIYVRWLHQWYHPEIEERVTRELLALGADVIMMDSDSTAPVLTARDGGAYAIGYHSDVSSFAPDAVLTSAVWKWGVYYTRRIKAVQDGSWTSQDTWEPMSTGIVDLAPFGAVVPQLVRDQVQQKRAEIERGDVDVFHGPVLRQDESTWVPQGGRMTDMEMLTMTGFVEGIDGEVPTCCNICGPMATPCP